MKKILTKFLPFLLLISLISCNQLVVGIEKTFSYWANGATIIGIELPPNLPVDGDGFSSLPSGQNARICFKLNNPQKFEFLMPNDSNAPADIIVFDENVKGENGGRPEFGEGKDYFLIQKDSDTLELTYKKEFLLKNEQGKANLNPKIKLYNKKDNRRFAQNYNYKLRANTVPPKPEWVTTGKIKDGENRYYVLIFKFEGLTNSTDIENFLHKDISEVWLTEVGTQKPPIQVKLTTDGFNVSSSQGNLIPQDAAITALEPTDLTGGSLTGLSAIPNANDRKRMLCIKTGVKTGDSLSHKIKVKDLRGLASEETSGVTNVAKLPVPKISYHSDMGELTEYGVYKDDENALNNHSSSSTNPILISSCFRNSVILKAYHDYYPSDVTIEAEVKLSASSDFTGHKGRIQKIGNTTKILLDPIPKVDEIYEVKVKASASGPNYTDSDEKTYYYKIKKEVRAGTGSHTSSWQILKKAVASADIGDTIYIKGHIISTSEANNSGEIEVDNNINIKGSTGKDGDIIDANKDGANKPDTLHRIFRIKSGKSLNLADITLQNGKADIGGAILAENGSTLTLDNTAIKSSEATSGGGAISTGGILTINDGSVISGNKALTGYGGAIAISNSGTLIMTGGTIENNTAATGGGAVYNNGTFKISGSAKIVSSADPDENTLGKNDVYLPMGKVITVTGVLTQTSVARITPADNTYTAGRQVVKGDPAASPPIDLSTQVSKFKVTNDPDDNKWKINDSGQLELANKTITVTSWGELKTEVEKTDGAEIIIVDGTLIAGATDTEITVKRNVTIKGKDSSATLDANKKCRIFTVKRNKKLILENLTLQKGDATKSSGENGGAIYLNQNASLEMRSGVIIKDNKAKQGGGIYIGQNAEFLMTGGTIENNIGQGDSHGKAHGGAVYVYGTFKMSGSAKITPSTDEDEHKKGKNDVYLTTGKVITVTGVLTQTSVARITPAENPYIADRQVVEADSGVTLADKVSKFKVTNDPDGKKWKVNDAGKLEKDNQGKTIKTWADLKTEVEKPSGGAEVIIVEGTLTAGGASDEIKVKRDVTIKGKDSHAILNADERCRIFSVLGTCKLTLENITLTKGKPADGQSGGAIFAASQTTLILDNTHILSNILEHNNTYGAGVRSLGTVIMKNGSHIDNNIITGNGKGAGISAKDLTIEDGCVLSGNINNQGMGGAIFVALNHSLIIKGSSTRISGNKAKEGGGIYMAGSLTMEGGSIENNEATGGGFGHGGAIYHAGDIFSMSSSAKITPSANPNEHTHGKNDVYLSNNKTIKITETLDAGQNQAARITVPKSKYNTSTQVLTGNTNDNANKFKVTKKGTQNWYVDNDGKLKELP